MTRIWFASEIGVQHVWQVPTTLCMPGVGSSLLVVSPSPPEALQEPHLHPHCPSFSYDLTKLVFLTDESDSWKMLNQNSEGFLDLIIIIFLTEV